MLCVFLLFWEGLTLRLRSVSATSGSDQQGEESARRGLAQRKVIREGVGTAMPVEDNRARWFADEGSV